MKYRFARCELDTAARTLLLDGQDRHIEPKAYEVLLFLIEQRERAVGRDELIDAVWKGRIVSEWTLSSAISGVRRAIDDDGAAQKLVKTVRGYGFRFVGEVTVPETLAPAVAHAGPAAPEAETKSYPSIAVRPFSSVGNAHDNGAFARDLSEDIAAALSRMRWLFVVSFGSTHDLVGAAHLPQDIAQALDVRYLLSGRVRQVDDALRITCQLSDTEFGRLLWSESYDGDMSDVFVLQDQITLRIATTLSSEVTLAEVERARRAHPSDLDAWRAYLRALTHMHLLSAEANETAKACLAQSLAQAPDFAPAHAALAWCAGYEAVHGWQSSGTAALAAAERHAETALQFAPDEPRAHCAMALVHFLNGRHEEVFVSTARAIELDPNMPDAHGILGNALAISGEASSALQPLERALQGSPRDPTRWFWSQGMANALFAMQDYGAALGWARRTVEIRPGWIFGHLARAASAGQLGLAEEAGEALARVVEIVPGYSLERFRRKAMWTSRSDIERFEAGLRAAGIR
ncbi:MAG: winged helix-turn-helix domain-containing protein [Pseudomonadota bacterium]